MALASSSGEISAAAVDSGTATSFGDDVAGGRFSKATPGS
jgi:hypothetical protein